jgi:hypothetical protein
LDQLSDEPLARPMLSPHMEDAKGHLLRCPFVHFHLAICMCVNIEPAQSCVHHCSNSPYSYSHNSCSLISCTPLGVWHVCLVLAQPHCTATFHSHVAQPYCTATLHSHIALPHCTATLHCHIAQPHCTATLHCHIALPHCTATLHCHVVLPHFSQPHCTALSLHCVSFHVLPLHSQHRPRGLCVFSFGQPASTPWPMCLVPPMLRPSVLAACAWSSPSCWPHVL